MVGKVRLSRLVFGAVVMAALECTALVVVPLATSGPAQAQNRDERYPFLHRQRSGSGGFFGDLFGNPGGGYRGYRQPFEQPAEQRPSTEHARAPAARKPTTTVPPTTSVVVIGDGMADWLAYGLEDAFADQPEVAIDRQNKYNSGLLRYDAKGDLDWWHVIRDILTKQKANYVVMMVGVSDRDPIREKDLAKEAEKQKAEKDQAENKDNKDAKEAKPGDKPAQDQKSDKTAEQKSITAPEQKKAPTPTGSLEFHTDQWAAVYTKRIDETIAALKSKGVPVFWVGLPSVRGQKSTTDVLYLNDLYRQRAERAGVVYIDIWDGFVDDAGKFTTFGPDYEGQMRRLRSADGVYFTQSGARKLAHYVEREIRRYMSNRTPVALPSGPITAPAATPSTPGKPAARPVAGPVVPLTVTATTGAEQLMGASATRPSYGDSTAADVLVKGEPVNAPRGRGDDFSWSGNEANGLAPTSLPNESAAPPTRPAVATNQPAIRQVEPPSGNMPAPPPPAQAATQPAAAATVAANPPPAKHNPTPRRHSNFPFNPFGWLR